MNHDVGDQTAYERNLGLLHKLARKVYGRCRAARLPMEYEDCMQEVSIAWMQAREKFDPSRGFRFSTYLVKAVFTHMNRQLYREECNTTRLGTVSMNTTVDGEAMDIESLVGADLDLAPDRFIELDDDIRAAKKRLSPEAGLVLDWVLNPPQQLLDEAGKRTAKAKRMAQQGYASNTSHGADLNATCTFVIRLLGLPQKRYLAIRKELNKLAA